MHHAQRAGQTLSTSQKQEIFSAHFLNEQQHVVGPSLQAAVDAFHAAALKAGGKDNGAPGLRPHYHANYYGAFVLDPDGHNIEAVCHLPA